MSGLPRKKQFVGSPFRLTYPIHYLYLNPHDKNKDGCLIPKNSV